MILTIIIAFLSIIFLAILHEFSHFIMAKKFGVKVEEFGIGLPPRIFGIKIGETIYSLNLLPFGAFVRLPGEIERLEDPRAFSNQSILKRMLIVVAGVVSFWIIGAILFAIVFNLGTFVPVDDEDSSLINPKVQVVGVLNNSPAKEAGLIPGDVIRKFSVSNIEFSTEIEKVKQLQELTQEYKGQEVILTIERGKEIFDLKVVPRVSPPPQEGPMGIVLTRTAFKSYPWYQAIYQGVLQTFNLTFAILNGYFNALKNLITKQPTGVQLTGPIGIVNFLAQAVKVGIDYYLQFIGLIAIYIAIFNIMPIPAFDGGKLLFLTIEAVRKKPISPKVEQNITAFFFTLLILLMIWVTIKDIVRIF